MSMTRADIRNLVKTNIGERTGIDDRINSWINLSLRDISQRHSWSDLRSEDTFNLISGTKTYRASSMGLSGTINYILSARQCVESSGTYSQSRELIVISPFLLDKEFPIPEQRDNGEPTHLAVRDDVLTFFPIPDSDYLVYLWWEKDTEDMTSDIVPPITNIDNVLVSRATYYAQLAFEEHEAASMWKREYEELLKHAILSDKKRPAWKPRPAFASIGMVNNRGYTNPFNRGV